MEQKKVSFIALYIRDGGAERVISLIANYFAEKNIEVQIIALASDEVSYYLNSKITHIYIKTKLKRPFHIVERIFKLRKSIKDSDAIISFMGIVNVYTLIASIFLNKKIIVSDRNDLESELKYKKLHSQIFIHKFPFLIKKFLKFFYRLASIIVFQTPDAKKYYLSSATIQKKSVVIPNPIAPYLPERHKGARKKEIFAMCRLAHQKNLKMMIDAFALLEKEHSEFILTIYGEGDLRPELEQYIEKLHLKNKISLPGFKKNIYNRVVDNYMYVSSSDYEGISNSMLEALGMGLPTIVTDCPIGGARMFVENNENGILISVGDIQAMYEGMKKIINDDVFREKISRNATKVKEDINEDIICKKWLDLIT